MEIYNEKIYDLLDDVEKNIEIRGNKGGQIELVNLK